MSYSRMLPFECEVFGISVKRLKMDSVNMSKNDIINKYSIKDFSSFCDSRLLNLMKKTEFYFLVASLGC